MKKNYLGQFGCNSFTSVVTQITFHDICQIKATLKTTMMIRTQPTTLFEFFLNMQFISIKRILAIQTTFVRKNSSDLGLDDEVR